MTAAKNALFKKILIFVCSVSVVTLCKPEYSFKYKSKEEAYNAGLYGGIFLTCAVGYQAWKWHSAAVESRHKEAIDNLQKRLTAATADKAAALKERDDAVTNQGTLRERIEFLETGHASLLLQRNAFKQAHDDLEMYCQVLHDRHNAELQRIRQHHAPKPMPSAPRQEDVEPA